MQTLKLISLVLLITLSGCEGSSSPPSNPVPSISSLSPSSVTAGGAAFTLAVNGNSFISTSTVQWNGSSQTTAYVSATQLTASITAADIAAAGNGNVTVVNPSPGGGSSGAASLAIIAPNPSPTISSVSPSSIAVGSPDTTITISGTGFITSSVVNFNGQPLKTSFGSASQLSAVIRAASLTAIGNALLTVSTPGPGGGVSLPSTIQIVGMGGRYRAADVGLWTYFDDRGYPSGYYPGQVIQNWDQFDSSVGSTVSHEISLQLDTMHAMGVNTITFDLRTSDNVSPQTISTFPACPVTPAVGFQYPQPTSTELANFPKFLDMVQGKGMKVFLILNNVHMDESTSSNWQTWLGAILNVAGSHPAIDLIMFGGDTHLVDTNGDGIPDACGIPAEPPLWSGPTEPPYLYVKWAIGYALSLGIPARKLSAECIVGSYNIEVQQPTASPGITGGHLWQTVAMLKSIFDTLAIPEAQRTYAFSIFEQNKCQHAGGLPCIDERADIWADETVAGEMNIIGTTAARVVFAEIGNSPPVDAAIWSTQHAFENLITLIEKYGIEGGCYYLWAAPDNNLDSDPTQELPIKRRGLNWTYTSAQAELLDWGGYHLISIPNPSFEDAAVNGGSPLNWSIFGDGSGSLYLLTQESGQPEVATRGNFALRLVNGTSQTSTETATSLRVGVLASTAYTTTANLRFSFSGDPNPSGTPSSRPQVSMVILYYTANGSSSSVRTSDVFSWFQENSTSGFATFPVQYTTPSDAAFVAIQFGILRNKSPVPITLDIDNVR